jgi:diguanylate cyclase (GGDEF)-like protein/PAS domain S-box-containing protein
MAEKTPPARSHHDAPTEARGGRRTGPDDDLDAFALTARYRAILEHSPTAILTLDRDGVILEVSKAATELMSMPAEQLVGAPIRDLIDATMRPLLDRALRGELVEYEGLGLPMPPEGESWLRATWVPVWGDDGTVLGGVALIHDASAEKKARDLVEKLEFIEPLTGLPNRAMLLMMLSRALSGAKASRRQLALVWINLDRFKDVNDALGQQAGDQLLCAVGERLHEAVRTNDMVAHVGAGDFVLLLSRVYSRKHLERLMSRIHDVFAAPFIVQDEGVFLTASCGIAVHPNGAADARQLQENAHTAMRAAKDLGGGACEIFESGVVEEGSARLWLAREIRDGIAQGHFTLHYQPLVSLDTMRVQSVEALARWQHPERGLLWPAEFIPFAEESGLIVLLGRHLLMQACDQLRMWQRTLSAAPRLAVNISAREVQRSDVCGEIKRAAAKAGLEPSSLEIEFTETAVLADPKRAAEVATCLRDVGVTVALDDLGTGYSSLTHLRELPIDRVKIDRSFVASCLEDRSASAILVAVAGLAHDLGMEVVAEGVETQAQLDFVKAAGCDAAQGYHLARPLPQADCTEYLRRAAAEPAL